MASDVRIYTGTAWQSIKGPTAVSADVNNLATLGTDNLLFVNPTAVANSAAVSAKYVEVAGDTMTGRLTAPNITANTDITVGDSGFRFYKIFNGNPAWAASLTGNESRLEYNRSGVCWVTVVAGVQASLQYASGLQVNGNISCNRNGIKADAIDAPSSATITATAVANSINPTRDAHNGRAILIDTTQSPFALNLSNTNYQASSAWSATFTHVSASTSNLIFLNVGNSGTGPTKLITKLGIFTGPNQSVKITPGGTASITFVAQDTYVATGDIQLQTREGEDLVAMIISEQQAETVVTLPPEIAYPADPVIEPFDAQPNPTT